MARVRSWWRAGLTVGLVILTMSMQMWVGWRAPDRRMSYLLEDFRVWLIAELSVVAAVTLVRWPRRAVLPLCALAVWARADLGWEVTAVTCVLFAGWAVVLGLAPSAWSFDRRPWAACVGGGTLVVGSLLLVFSPYAPAHVPLAIVLGGAAAAAVGRWVDGVPRIGRLAHTGATRAGPTVAPPMVDQPRAEPEEGARAKRPSLLFALGAWLVGGVASLATMRHLIGPQQSSRLLGASFVRMDGLSYVDIAQNGVRILEYPRSTVDKLPGYPLLVRLTQVVVKDWNSAAAVTSFTATGVALLLFAWWMSGRGVAPNAQRFAVAALCVYPYGFFLFGFAYSESTFLILALAAFLLLDRDLPVPAALAAAAASLVRPVGVVLVLAVVVAAAEREWRRRTDRVTEEGGTLASRRGDEAEGGPACRRRVLAWRLAPLAAISGQVGYSIYCWHRWGDVLAYAHGQGRIAAHPNLARVSTWALSSFLASLTTPQVSIVGRANQFAQAAIVVLLVCCAPRVQRAFRLAAATYVVGLAVLTLATTPSFTSAGRYAGAAFPLVALVGRWMAGRPAAAVPLLVVAAGLWVFFYQEFVEGVSYAM